MILFKNRLVRSMMKGNRREHETGKELTIINSEAIF